MKLELKHLAPYLPYKLKLQYGSEDYRVMNAGPGSGNHWVGITAIMQRQSAEIHPIPILRPLSDLSDEYIYELAKYTNELELNISIQEATYLIKSRIHNPVNMPYIVLQKLFEWHFDVFGLIEKGLAIDIKNK